MIGTVALVGGTMLIGGQLTLMQFFCFLLVASRLYEPMSSTLIALAAINALQINVDRMNDINHTPKQTSGERQRISIARAFLKDAPIILLDEATASLDVENETKVQSALSRLIQDKTVMVIAHRMRMVAGANKVVVLSDGGVAEHGQPAKLMEQDGLFAQMVRLQTEGQN